MNKDKVMAMVRKKSAESGVSINTLLLLFFFERFLSGVSKSGYKTNLILKGGFLLSSMIGIETRTTMDMDMALKGRNLDEETILSIFKDLAIEASDDELSFEVASIEEIKIDDEYPGYKVSVLGKLQNIRQPFSIDIATGDPITPDAIEYRYNSVFAAEDAIEILSYNLETIIAEKLETLVSRKTDNSRSKDLYDLYTIFALNASEIDKSKLIKATKNTFRYRGTPFDLQDIFSDLEDIKGNSGFKRRWDTYCKRNAYVEPVDFDQLIETITEKLEEFYK